ncbi:hypothetical protein CVT26_000929 [Gymnopilus dilepis]|uniref:Uncharacterized protein n=1 Tax=Gymnopilus dilepis TaxID=231916 RepID=A0A409VI37_9AGAR|nr:hypothetical protein CVT26_000929 [Gymnopilus dilepis]
MPVTNLRTRGSPSDSLQDTVLDILVIEFPKDGDYLVYEVELTRNYGSGKALGKDEAVTQCCEKGPPIADMQQGVERVHLLVPLPAQNTYLPDKV